MYFSKNSRYVLQRAQILSPTFLKVTEKNLSVKTPTDDPSKPPLRINIPKEGVQEKNYSKSIRSVNRRESRSRSFTSASRTPSYTPHFEGDLLPKCESEINFSNFVNDDLLIPGDKPSTGKVSNIEPSAFSQYHLSDAKEGEDYSNGLPTHLNEDTVEAFGNTYTDQESSKKTEIKAQSKNSEANADDVGTKSLYIVIDVPVEVKSVEADTSLIKDENKTGAVLETVEVTSNKKQKEDREINITRTSTSSPQISKFLKEKPERTKKIEIKEIEEAATYVLHLKLRGKSKKPSTLGCVPEKEVTTRKENFVSDDTPIRTVDRLTMGPRVKQVITSERSPRQQDANRILKSQKNENIRISESFPNVSYQRQGWISENSPNISAHQQTSISESSPVSSAQQQKLTSESSPVSSAQQQKLASESSVTSTQQRKLTSESSPVASAQKLKPTSENPLIMYSEEHESIVESSPVVSARQLKPSSENPSIMYSHERESTTESSPVASAEQQESVNENSPTVYAEEHESTSEGSPVVSAQQQELTIKSSQNESTQQEEPAIKGLHSLSAQHAEAAIESLQSLSAHQAEASIKSSQSLSTQQEESANEQTTRRFQKAMKRPEVYRDPKNLSQGGRDDSVATRAKNYPLRLPSKVSETIETPVNWEEYSSSAEYQSAKVKPQSEYLNIADLHRTAEEVETQEENAATDNHSAKYPDNTSHYYSVNDLKKERADEKPKSSGQKKPSKTEFSGTSRQQNRGISKAEAVNFKTSSSCVSISCDKPRSGIMKFCAAFPPLLNEALKSRFKFRKDFNIGEKLGIQLKGAKSLGRNAKSRKESDFMENSILFPKKECEKFDCESLFTTKEEVIMNIIKSEEEKAAAEKTRKDDSTEKIYSDTLSMMKKVKEIVQFDLDNAVKIFHDGKTKEVSSVVVSKGDSWEVNMEEMSKQLELAAVRMQSSLHQNDFKGDILDEKINGEYHTPKYLPPTEENPPEMKLSSDEDSVITFDPNTNEFSIQKDALAKAIARGTNESFSEISQTLDLLARGNRMESKSGDSILVFDDETQSWKVDFSILERREEQQRIEEELTKRSEMILETFEKLEKGQITNVPLPETGDKKTFDYKNEQWSVYNSDKKSKEKSKFPFRECDAEEIRKKNSDMYDNLFIGNKKDNRQSGKTAPGLESTKLPKKSKSWLLAEDKNQQKNPPQQGSTPVLPPPPQQGSTAVPSPPQQGSTPVPPPPPQQGSTPVTPSPPQQGSTPVTPSPPQQGSTSVPPPPPPQQGSTSVPPPPPQQGSTPVTPPPPQQGSTPVPPSPQQGSTPVPPSPQQGPTPVPPPPPQQGSTPVTPPSPQQGPTPVPPSPQQGSTPVPPSPQQGPTPVPPPQEPASPTSDSKLPVEEKGRLNKVEENYWGTFLDMDILPRDIREIKTPMTSDITSTQKPSSIPPVPPPKPVVPDGAHKKIDEPKFKIRIPFIKDKKIDKSDDTSVSKGSTKKIEEPKKKPTAPPPSSSKPSKKQEKSTVKAPPVSSTTVPREDPNKKPPPTIGSSKSSSTVKTNSPQESTGSGKPDKVASATDHYVSDKIIELSRTKPVDPQSKVKTNKIETVKLNITSDTRLPSKVTEINLSKKSEEKPKETVAKTPSDSAVNKTQQSTTDSNKFLKNLEKYKTPFGEPDFDEKSQKIKADIENNPNLKKLDSWSKTLVLHDIMKPPENIECWLKDETDKMATLLLKVLQEAADGKPKKKQLPNKNKNEKQTGKGNPYDNIRKKQETTPENFLFRVRTVNLSLEDKKKPGENAKLNIKSEQLKEIPLQSEKTTKPSKMVEAVKPGKEMAEKVSQVPISMEDTKSKALETAFEPAVISRDVSQANRLPIELTDEIPGPEILKKISNTWKVFPILGSQMTIFTLLRVFQLVNLGSSILSSSHPDKTRRHAFSKLFLKYGPIVNVQGPLSGNVILIHMPEHLSGVFEQDITTSIRSVFDSLEHSRRETEESGISVGISTDWSKPEWNDLKKETVDPLLKSTSKYLGLCDSSADSLVNTVKRNRNAQNFVSEDFMDDIRRWSLEGFCSVIFEKSFGLPEGRNNTASWILEPDKLYQAIEEATNCLSKCERGFQMWRIMATPSATGLSRAYRSISSIVGKQLYQVELNLKSKSEILKNESSLPVRDLTFLESMLLNDAMTTDEITCNLVDMILIGTNTMNSTMGFLLYDLAQNVKVQMRLLKELKEAFPKKDSPLSYNSISSLRYLQACLKETVRLHFPVPVFYRLLQNDIMLANYVVPKGTFVVMDYRVSSMKEQVFDDPDKFIPERWLTEDLWLYSIQPFGVFPLCHGPRADLARRVIDLQLLAGAAKLLRNFQVEYQYGEILGTDAIFSLPDKPLKLNFIEREL